MLHPPLCPGGRGAVVYIDWCITRCGIASSCPILPVINEIVTASIKIRTIFADEAISLKFERVIAKDGKWIFLSIKFLFLHENVLRRG